jgi:hypothetical protein
MEVLDKVDFERSYSPEPTSGCWLWMRGCTSAGYGVLYLNHKPIYAHRMSAHLHLGLDLSSELQVLHKCDNPLCINPHHLFIGDNYENHQDMSRKTRGSNQFKGKSHCREGHEFNTENTIIDKFGYRACKVCKRTKERERDRLKRQQESKVKVKIFLGHYEKVND